MGLEYLDLQALAALRLSYKVRQVFIAYVRFCSERVATVLTCMYNYTVKVLTLFIIISNCLY